MLNSFQRFFINILQNINVILLQIVLGKLLWNIKCITNKVLEHVCLWIVCGKNDT